MKRIILLGMTVTALLLSNCSNEEVTLENDTLNTVELSASINEPDSRAAVSDDGVFSWTTGDQIEVHTSGDPAWQPFTLEGNGGSSSGTFRGTIMGNATITSCALHPASLGHVLKENKLTLTLPSEYEFKEGITNVLMLAPIKEENSNLVFKHLGGLFRFVIKNIPETASKFVFIATGKKLTGQFVIDNITSVDPQITTSNANTENTVTINFTASSGITERRFYVPVPTGTYEALKCEIRDAENTLLTTTNIADSKEVGRADLKLVPEITCTNVDGGIAVNAATADALSNALTSAVTAEGGQEVPKATTITVDKDLSGTLPETITVPVSNTSSSVTPVVTLAFSAVPQTQSSSGTGGSNALKITDGTMEGSLTPAETSKATIEVAIPQIEEGGTAPNAELVIPTSTGVLAATTGTAAYGDVTAITADNTLIVNKGVTVKSLTIKGGSVKIYGTVTTLTINENSTTSKVLVYPGGSCGSFTDNRTQNQITLTYVPGDSDATEDYITGDSGTWD